MIYLDNAATTACDEAVIEAMLPFFRSSYGNASSVDHLVGSVAKRAVDNVRVIVSDFLQAQPEDVIFTSGSTEANNLISLIDLPMTISNIEHPSTAESFAARKNTGDFILKISANGLLDRSAMMTHLLNNPEPRLLSLIATNNEIGVEQDLDELSALCRDSPAILHLDATQTLGTKPISFKTLGVDAISLSAHKLHGPKGVGALIATSSVRRRLVPNQRGGGQERGYRPGTLNVPGIVGLGKAILQLGNVIERRRHIKSLRSAFLKCLQTVCNDIVAETVQDCFASPHILSLRFAKTSTRALLSLLSNEVSFSLGAACSSSKVEPSKILLALGLSSLEISRTARFSFAHNQTHSEVKRAATLIGEAANQICDLSMSA